MHDIDYVYLEEIEKYKKLIVHEELLVVLSKRGFKNAKIKLGQSKQELLVNICLEYIGIGLSFMDLINEAGSGLNEGIEQIVDYQHGELDEFLKPFIEKAIHKAMECK